MGTISARVYSPPHPLSLSRHPDTYSYFAPPLCPNISTTRTCQDSLKALAESAHILPIFLSLGTEVEI